MLRRFALAAALLAAPAPALAEWVHIPAAARAQATADTGAILAAYCQPNGFPGLAVEEIWPATEYISVDLAVDGQGWTFEARCEAGVCPLNLMSLPMVAEVMAALQSGGAATLSYTQGAMIGRVSLSGSRAAIGQVLGQCPA